MTSYTGAVAFTSSDAKANLPSGSTLTNGVGSFTATLYTAGSQTITAYDVSAPTLTETSATIAVGAASASTLLVTAPSSAMENVATTFTVTALDAYGNTATSYTGPVAFTSTDAKASLPSSSKLTNGSGSFTATLNTIGSQNITATDANTSSLKGTSSAISVGAGPASTLSVSAPSSDTAGEAITYTVTALDSSGHAATNYSGAVTFTSSDAKATFSPASSTLTNGVGSFQVTLNTVGSQTIAVSDVSTPTLTGTSAAIAVSAGAVSTLSTSAPSAAIVGSAITFAVTAHDASGNTATNYAGPVKFSSSDSTATFSSAGGSLTNGAGSFQATFETAGVQTITATDANASSLKGTSGNITVVATKPALTVSQVPQGMVGMPFVYSNFSVSGGAPPYTYSYQNAPSGLSLSTADEKSLAGVPTTTAVGSTNVTLTVTDLAGSSNSANFTVSVVDASVAANNSALQGQYLCSVEQYVDTPKTTPGGDYLYRGGLVFSMTADGSGGVTINEGDGNSPVKGYYMIGSASGSYIVGADHRGYIKLNSAMGTASVFALAGGKLSSGVFQELSLTEMDDAGSSPSGTYGSGRCYPQSNTLAGVKLNGIAYVFSGRGEDNIGYAEATIGEHLFTAVSGSTGYTVVLTQDLVDGPALDSNTTNSFTAGGVDQYGRVALTDSNGALAQVIYLAGNPSAYSNTNYGVLMVAYSHSSANTQDFFLAQMRQQNPSAIKSADPTKSGAILYASGAAYCPSGATTCTPSNTPHYRARIMHIYPYKDGGAYWLETEVKNIDGVSIIDPSPDPEGLLYLNCELSQCWTPWTGPSAQGRMIWATNILAVPTNHFYMYLVDTDITAILVDGTDPTDPTTELVQANNPDPDNPVTKEFLQGMSGWGEPLRPCGSSCRTTWTWYLNYFQADYFVSKLPNGNYNGKEFSGIVDVNVDASGNYDDFRTYTQDSGASLWSSWGAGVDDGSITTAKGALNMTSGEGGDGGGYGLMDVTVTGSSKANPSPECYGIHQSASTGSGYNGMMACIDIYTRAPSIYLLQE